jgi:hypothetical protein
MLDYWLEASLYSEDPVSSQLDQVFCMVFLGSGANA